MSTWYNLPIPRIKKYFTHSKNLKKKNNYPRIKKKPIIDTLSSLCTLHMRSAINENIYEIKFITAKLFKKLL